MLKNPFYVVRQLLLIILLITAATSIAIGNEESSDWQPNLKPKLDIKKANGEIKIDGDLSDPGWTNVAIASNFSEHSPGEEIKPPVETKVFMTYDESHVYFAAICYAEKGSVRASLAERESIFADDNIGFFFDTYGDAERAYIINLNPYGIPYDALWTRGQGEDGAFDMIFESSGQVTDSGYQVEMAIPFSSLRFPNKDVHTWRVEFYRHHNRESHYSISWAYYDKEETSWLNNWGTATGISDVAAGKGLEIMPTFVSYQSATVSDWDRPDISFENSDLYGELSLNGKYALSSSISVEATFNPDFSQVEADAAQINVNSTFALSFPERRPFFQEGVDLFRTNFRAVYTRAINDPAFATKLSGRVGSASIAYMAAYDERSPMLLAFEESSVSLNAGKSYSNIFAIKQNMGEDSHLRFLLTDRRFEGGGSGTLASIDARLKLSKQVMFVIQGIGTHTEEPPNLPTPLGSDEEPWWLAEDTSFITFDKGRHTTALDGESFYGGGILSSLSYNAASWGLDLTHYERSRTYRAANGFQPRNGDRRVMGNGYKQYRFENKPIERVTFYGDLGRIWDLDGLRKDEWISAGLNSNWSFAQTYIGLNSLFASNERLGGIDFRGIWALTPSFSSRLNERFSISFHYTFGRQIARSDLEFGFMENWSTSANIKISDKLKISPSYDHLQSESYTSDELFYEGWVGRTRINYQFSRELSLRVVAQYNSFSEQFEFDPLLTFRINPFSIFYIGTTYDYTELGLSEMRDVDGKMQMVQFESPKKWLTSRQIFMKLQYLFQI